MIIIISIFIRNLHDHLFILFFICTRHRKFYCILFLSKIISWSKGLKLTITTQSVTPAIHMASAFKIPVEKNNEFPQNRRG